MDRELLIKIMVYIALMAIAGMFMAACWRGDDP